MKVVLVPQLLIYINLILIVTTLAISENNKDNILEDKNGKICVTPGCIHAASSVLKHLDQSIGPCDDFYQFACGNFIKENIIPDDKTSINNFAILSDRMMEQLRRIIEEPPEPNEPKPFVLLKSIYSLCMNKTAIKENGLKTIKSILQQIGGWPVVEGPHWKENEFDWKTTMYEFRKAGLPFNDFLSMYVEVDEKNSSRRIIQFNQSPLGLDREHLEKGFKEQVVSAYLNYLVDVAVIFGAKRETALHNMRESVEFEMQLAKITLPKEELRNFTKFYNLMTISELQEKYPSIPWIEYINNILAIPSIAVNLTDVVDVNMPKFISDLEKLVGKTPKRVQSNYLMGQIVISVVTYLTKELRDRELQFFTTYIGIEEREPRWKECLELTTLDLDIAAGALYIRKYFNEDAKKNAVELVANLKSTFLETLKKLNWMDESTKKKALEKAAAMKAHVAYSQELLDNKKLDEYYAKLASTANNYLEFHLNIKKFKTDKIFEKLLEPVNKSDWTEVSTVAIVNAYYKFFENSILLPAGILQGVFFDNERPHYMNYGAIGYIIGHEITHGFDDMGRQFDKDGTLTDWWAAETNEAFVNKAQCIIDQYSNYTAPAIKMKLNGVHTQGENIADNGGIKQAHLAYDTWIKSNGEEARLPGLNYTSKQMFWISAANIWCSKERPEILRQLILTNPHAPEYFRVIGSLSNSKSFSEDFNCPEGSKMNPKQKCEVW